MSDESSVSRVAYCFYLLLLQLKDQALAPLEDSSGGSTVSSISRSTDAVLSGVIAALKTVPAASYSDQEVTQQLSHLFHPSFVVVLHSGLGI